MEKTSQRDVTIGTQGAKYILEQGTGIRRDAVS